MKFDELDKRMRVFETINDSFVLPGLYIVARLDGRGFTKLTKEKHDFEKPFDERFSNYMIETVVHLMDCGFNVIYGYSQSDEISLLFDLNDNGFSRKERKIVSILSGEASAKFSSLLGDIAVFDCRISKLTSPFSVVDYFRWRSEDAFRNSLNAHCYWLLRKNGKTKTKSTKFLEKMSVSDKNKLLFENGINYNNLPEWQKRGVGVYRKLVEKEGINLKTKAKVITKRNVLFVDKSLPVKHDYDAFILNLLDEKRKD